MKKVLLISILVLFNLSAYEYDNSHFCTIYHGSSKSFDEIQSSYNEKKDFDDNMCWKGIAIFGAHDYRIALFYTYDKTIFPAYRAKIKLRNKVSSNEPILYHIIGGDSKEDALRALYGPKSLMTNGYIYILDGRYFKRESGLGLMEGITRDSKALIGKISINRRKEIDYYVEQGLIDIKWSRQ